MGRIDDMARRDLKRFSGDRNGFATDLIFEPTEGDTVTVQGRADKIHLAVDFDGNRAGDTIAWCSVSEEALTDAGYTVRNERGVVALENHRISFADSTGVVTKYVVATFHPDESLGFILIYLGAFA